WPALAAKVTTNSKTYRKPAGTSTASSQTKQRRPTMSDQYTPTTQQVEDGFSHEPEYEYANPIGYGAQVQSNRRAFRRWLATVKAEAWQEGALWAAAECGVIEPDCPPEQWLTPGDNPYREQETT